MLVENQTSPLAIQTQRPRFSWKCNWPGRNRYQSAYRILVSSSPETCLEGKADIWDSSKVMTSQSTQIEYAGTPLDSNRTYFWRVEKWDEEGGDTELSPVEQFGTGLFEIEDWSGTWIGMGAADEPKSDPASYAKGCVAPEFQEIEPDMRSPMLRKDFSLTQSVSRARVYICGLGFSELRLNGDKVGEDYLSTPRTDFRKTCFYSTYDITEQLVVGENTFGILLGNGWFNGHKKYWGWQNQWYGSPRVILHAVIEYDDGSSYVLGSDGSWRGDWSEITFNHIYDGEHVDSRKIQLGWDSPKFDSSRWVQANEVPSPEGKLKSIGHKQEGCTDRFAPVAIHEPRVGVYVVDAGRNMTGWLKIRIRNSQKGDLIKVHYGEAIHDNFELNSSSNNAALQCDEYICSGGSEEIFEPRFTFHGFQFAEITGLRQKPKADDLEACFVRTAVEQTGFFECSNDLINKIHSCTLQSQLCNVQMGVPTDDTQRPERLGWGADAWAVAQEALYNCSVTNLFEKWIGDFRDQQDDTGVVSSITPRPGIEEDLVWSASFVLIPWWVYLHCGNKRILEENYVSLKKYLEYLRRVGIREIHPMPTQDILDKLFDEYDRDRRFPSDSDQGHLQISQWGDHLATSEGAATRSGMPLCIATAFYYVDVTTMEKIADSIGRHEDANEYRKLAEEIKVAFNERFYEPAVGFYDGGVQSAQAWALAFGLTSDENHKSVSNYFLRCIEDKQRHLTTGYAGTKFAIQALGQLGREDLIYQLATSEEYPSWGHMLRLGRTTSCEQWGGERGSLNHAPLGAAIDEWFYSGLAGIKSQADGPGFSSIQVKPYIPNDLEWARASLSTDRGIVFSGWQQSSEEVTLKVTIPGNSRATIVIPSSSPNAIWEGDSVAGSAEGVQLLSSDDEYSRYLVGSGSYSFRWQKG